MERTRIKAHQEVEAHNYAILMSVLGSWKKTQIAYSMIGQSQLGAHMQRYRSRFSSIALRHQGAIVLSWFIVVAFARVASGQTGAACNSLLAHGINDTFDISSQNAQITDLRTVLCENNNSLRRDVENDVGNHAIQIGVGASYLGIGGSTDFSKRDFTETDRQSLTIFARQFCQKTSTFNQLINVSSSKGSTLNNKAIDAWRQCIELLSKQISANVSFRQDQTGVDVTLLGRPGITATLQGINIDIGKKIACSITNNHVSNQSLDNVQFPLKLDGTGAININCSRRVAVNSAGVKYADSGRISILVSDGLSLRLDFQQYLEPKLQYGDYASISATLQRLTLEVNDRIRRNETILVEDTVSGANAGHAGTAARECKQSNFTFAASCNGACDYICRDKGHIGGWFTGQIPDGNTGTILCRCVRRF